MELYSIIFTIKLIMPISLALLILVVVAQVIGMLSLIGIITTNIKEIKNGINLIKDNPIHGGD